MRLTYINNDLFKRIGKNFILIGMSGVALLSTSGCNTNDNELSSMENELKEKVTINYEPLNREYCQDDNELLLFYYDSGQLSASVVGDEEGFSFEIPAESTGFISTGINTEEDIPYQLPQLEPNDTYDITVDYAHHSVSVEKHKNNIVK